MVRKNIHKVLDAAGGIILLLQVFTPILQAIGEKIGAGVIFVIIFLFKWLDSPA